MLALLQAHPGAAMEEERLRAPTIVPPNAQLAPAHTATAAIAAMGNRIEIALTTNPTHRSFSDAFTVPAFTHQILFESLLEVTNYSEFHQHRSGKELHIPEAIVMIRKMTLARVLKSDPAGPIPSPDTEILPHAVRKLGPAVA